MRTFFLHLVSTTSNATEDGEEPTSDFFFVDIDVVMFQLIQSKVAKLVVWVPGLVV